MRLWRGRRRSAYRHIPGTADRDRIRRLPQRRPFLGCRARHFQRVLIETGSDLVTLLGSVLVTLLGREEEPFVGFAEILLHANTAGVKDGEVVLAVGDAAIGGLAEPLRGGSVIRFAVGALGVEDSQIVHGLAMPLVRSGAI